MKGLAAIAESVRNGLSWSPKGSRGRGLEVYGICQSDNDGPCGGIQKNGPDKRPVQTAFPHDSDFPPQDFSREGTAGYPSTRKAIRASTDLIQRLCFLVNSTKEKIKSEEKKFQIDFITAKIEPRASGNRDGSRLESRFFITRYIFS